MILQVAMVISNTNHVGLIHQASIAPGRPYRQHFQCQPQLRHGIWLAKKQAKHTKIQGGIHSLHRTSLDSPTFCSKLCSMMARNLGLECAVSKNGRRCLWAMSIFRRVLESSWFPERSTCLNSFAYGGYLDQTNCRSQKRANWRSPGKKGDTSHLPLLSAACLGTGIWHRTTPHLMKLMRHSKISGCVQSLGRVQRHFLPASVKLSTAHLPAMRQWPSLDHLRIALGALGSIPFQLTIRQPKNGDLVAPEPSCQPGNKHGKPSKTAMAIHLTWNALSFFGGKDFSNPRNSTKLPGADQFEPVPWEVFPLSRWFCCCWPQRRGKLFTGWATMEYDKMLINNAIDDAMMIDIIDEW